MRLFFICLGLSIFPWIAQAQVPSDTTGYLPDSLGVQVETSQDLPATSPADTLIDTFFDPAFKADPLPPILMKTEPRLIALSVVRGLLILPGAYLYIGCHS